MNNKFVDLKEVIKPINRFKSNPELTEQEYYMNEAVKIDGVPCPNCADVQCLFRGGVYIGCRSCLCYFDVDKEGRLIK